MVRPVHTYVAGAWSEQWARARPAMEKLRAAGCSISYDWTVPEGARLNGDLTPNQRRSYASSDMRGVLMSDVLLLLAPQEPSQGAWVELGIALAQRTISLSVEAAGPPTVIVVAGATPACIFAELADKEFATDDEAIDYISGMRREPP